MNTGAKDLIKVRQRIIRSLKLKPRKYNTLLDALHASFTLKKLGGLTVFELVTNSEHGGVDSKFSPLGLFIYTIWVAVYFYSAYKICSEDQTILRELYDTRLKHYGDVFERVVSTAFVTYVLWKIPFDTSLRPRYIKELLDIDDSIEGMGVQIDHRKDAQRLLTSCLMQFIAGAVRFFSVWIMRSQLETEAPKEILFQVSATDVLALIVAAHYSYYVLFLYNRHNIINNVLTEIKDRKSWEQRVLVRSKPMNIQKAWDYQDKYVCEKIKTCAKAYGLLFNAVESVLAMYGFAIVFTLSYCLWYIVLYLFYFMEATAAGLFHNAQRYTYFLIYIIWQIVYAVGVIFVSVYVSDFAVTEAGRTSYIVHEIINADDMSPPITEEFCETGPWHPSDALTTGSRRDFTYTLGDIPQAVQFSLQLIHQVPAFTACGLCKIDYTLLLQGAWNVLTFLVILLQFVMD